MDKKKQNFEHDYKNYYLKKIEHIKSKYPNITGKGRRTGRSLKNICFFTWSYAKEEDDEIINLLLKSSVLLSAQDDFYDNPKISDDKKREFYNVCENIIKERQYKATNKIRQFKELILLWEEVIRETNKAPFHLYSYWQKKAINMNQAMVVENQILREKNTTFNEYMNVSVNSVGIMFIWATYLLKKNISKTELRKINPTLFIGAKVTRLSNDLASYRRTKKELNAVTIINKKYPIKYIIKLNKKEQNKFNKDLSKITIDNHIKQTIKNSVNFLVNFYKISDFD